MAVHEFRMPSLGADMDAGTLVAWNVKPGDCVKRGQVVAVVETQKGAIDVEIWEDGVIEKLVVETGSKVPVGEVLATVVAEGEAGAAPVAEMAQPSTAIAATAIAPAVEALAPPAARNRVAPSARRLAQELGMDPDSVSPAQPGGVVSREDVERAAQARGKAPATDWHVRMRAAIGAAMSRSKREIPHYYLATDVDVTVVSDWLAEENRKRSVAERLLPVVPMMKAVALALREVPELNGFWRNGAFQPSATVHLGMAIAMRGGGLVAPAIHDADGKGLDRLMSDLRDLITRVRGGRLRSSEKSDPTVTFTNLGEQGVDSVLGVIYPPQVAIVGMGRISERPWVIDAAVAVRKTATFSLAADHRVSDGHRGGLFLAALGRLLQEPERLR